MRHKSAPFGAYHCNGLLSRYSNPGAPGSALVIVFTG
jgi:hypothetical protein